MSNLTWYIKQLFPLSYYSHFYQGEIEKVSTWKMWFGKCYDIHQYTVEKEDVY